MTIAEFRRALNKMRTTIYNFSDEETEVSTFDPRYDSGYEKALNIRFEKDGIKVTMACNIEALSNWTEEEEPEDCKYCEFETLDGNELPCSGCCHQYTDLFKRKETITKNEEEKTI